jgi:hypothetical protein
MYELELMLESDRLSLSDVVTDYMVFQTDGDSGIYQFNANGTWDYIGGRPPKR